MQATLGAALALTTLALAAGAQEEGGRRPAPEPRRLGGTPVMRGPSVPSDWEEDADRHRRAWESMLGGDAYLAALEATGMAAWLAGAKPGGTLAAESASYWTRSGPVGGFGLWGDNGRVSGLQLVSSGGTDWVYAGACAGGLWRSDLAGLGTWESLGDLLPNPAVRAFAVHPQNSQRIVVGTGDWARYRGAGLYATDDGGASWNAVSVSPTPQHFYRILHSLDDPDVMVAASDNGMWRSTNAGSSWSLVAGGHWSDVRLHPFEPNAMYAVRVGTGVYQSTTKGASWTQLTSPALPAAADWGRSTLATCRDYPSTVALAVEKNGLIHGVYRSPNDGASWSDITSNLGSFGGGQAAHAQALSFHPSDPDELFLGTDTIARSYWDAGALQIKWLVGESAAGLQIGHADITQLVFSPITGDDILWIPNDGGLYYRDFAQATTFGANGNASTGLVISQIDHLDADRAMLGIGLQDNGVLRSVDGAGTWTRVSVADGGDVEITEPEHLDMWFWTGIPWYPRRLIYGQSIETLPNPGMAASFHYDPVADLVWSGGSKTVWSAGADASPVVWNPAITSGLHPAPNHAVRRLWGSKLESGTLFLSFGYQYDGDITVVRWDGSGWEKNATTGLAPTGWIEAITPSSEWPGECWAGLNAAVGQPKVLHTTDYGVTWEDLTGSLASVRTVYNVVPQPFKPSVLFAATDVGMFRSTDSGQSWQPFQDGLPVVGVRGLSFVADDAHTSVHKLRAATYGRGTWVRDVIAPPIVYVDRDFTGTEDGTFQHPWNTVGEAVAAAPAGAVVALRANTYTEPQTITKDLTLVTYMDTSVIR